MMKNILIDKQYYPQIINMINATDNKKRTSLITFIIDKAANTITLIGGKHNAQKVIKLPFEGQDPTLQDGKWSIDDNMFKYYCQVYLKNNTDNKEIILTCGKESKTGRHVIGFEENGAFRRWQYEAVCEEHLEYVASLAHKTFQTISVSALHPMLEVASSHSPLEYFKIDKAQHEITIMRDNDISRTPLPQDLIPEIDLAANQDGLDILKHTCQHTQSDTLMINIDNEQLTVTDGQHSQSCSLESLSEFYNKVKINYTTEVKCVFDIYALKSEIEAYTHINQIKHNNISLLYFTQTDVFISGFGTTVDSFKNLSALDITVKEPLLYNINLRQLLKVRIKNITDMKGITLRILKAPDGSRKLAFYNERDPKRPYTSIPIELNTDNNALMTIQTLMAIYNEHYQGDSYKQADLLGYDDI
ncbi:hypothetical protein [Photobacterium leiognathi]|uniref:hypothetical protein n=1 Tax=Photobacterium leiognathi TaxID=553611 RepID=UPI002982B777|nr:hypothetical protein [Photobacterium leiognathi]